MKAEITEISHESCVKRVGDNFSDDLPSGITQEMICADPNITNTNTCSGDSGSPITIEKDDIHFIHGISSFGIDCKVNFPSFYLKLTNKYIRWIENVVWTK